MNDHLTHALSDYLDGDLGPHERASADAHLASCAECRALLEELRAVKDRAGALVDPPTPDDLWAGIASRIGSAGSATASRGRILALPRRRAFSAWPSLAAAAAVLVVAFGAFWLVNGARRAEAPGTVATRDAAPAETTQLATFDAARVEGEIAQLQRSLDRGRGKLDPKTVQVLEQNLALIRQATEDARAALAKDPANRELQDYFAGTVQSKLDLMRRATAMVGV